MIVKKLDRRYTQCRHNDYWLALQFNGSFEGTDRLLAYVVEKKLEDHYGPARYAMVGNPCPWYREYKNYAKDIVIYLRDAGMLTFLQLSGVFSESD